MNGEVEIQNSSELNLWYDGLLYLRDSLSSWESSLLRVFRARVASQAQAQFSGTLLGTAAAVSLTLTTRVTSLSCEGLYWWLPMTISCSTSLPSRILVEEGEQGMMEAIVDSM